MTTSIRSASRQLYGVAAAFGARVSSKVRVYGFLFLVMPATLAATFPSRRQVFAGTNLALALSLLVATVLTALYRLAEAAAQRASSFESAPWEPML